MKYGILSRRMFLQGAGKAALAIPFLPSLLPEKANALALPPSKYIHINSNASLYRMLATPLANGPYPVYTQPQGVSPDKVPWINKDADTKYQKLQDIVNYQGKVSWLVDEKWNNYLSRMILVSNAHAYVADNRHSSSINSCCSIGPGSVGGGDIYGPLDKHSYSVDFLIEQAMKRLSPTQLGALRVNIMEDAGGYSSYCFGTINGVPQRLPMLMAVDELKLKILGSISTANQPQAATLNRRSRIDHVLADFQAIMNNKRISKVDKDRLSSAAELWHSIDTKLATGAGTMACSTPNFPATPADWGARHRLAMDIVALALQCGVTRTVSYTLLQASDTNNDQGQIHGWEHDPRDPGGDAQITSPYFGTLMRWRADKVLYLLGKLDSMKDETGAPLLNSSLVTYSGQYSYLGHAMLGHNLIAVGGANGRLDTGWHVDAGGAPINRFHLTNMLAMGLSLTDIEKSGVAGFGEVAAGYDTGSTNQLLTYENDYDARRVYDYTKLAYFAQDSERRKPFPYLK